MTRETSILGNKGSHQRSIPAFLHKLYNMVDDISTNSYIQWSKDGFSFIVHDQEAFSQFVLPRFYKHNTFASFVRQLNMYDFYKIPHATLWQFKNPFFRRGRSDLLTQINRKRNSHSSSSPPPQQQQRRPQEEDKLEHLFKEIKQIKHQQIDLTSDLVKLQQERQLIWQESQRTVREYQQRHQQVITKVLQFLTAVFSTDYHHHHSVKRVMAEQPPLTTVTSFQQHELPDVTLSDPFLTTTTTTTTTTMLPSQPNHMLQSTEVCLYPSLLDNNGNNSNTFIYYPPANETNLYFPLNYDGM
ncbi:MAG: hypothetical protein EXX96DRAFT_548379 [Benjaminiella poitrasii]|nr:MAG: hypothetical protein EXX96DRAFT_548379 [Benjaminiella poitrasii]